MNDILIKDLTINFSQLRGIWVKTCMNVVSTKNNEVSAIVWVKFPDVSVLALCLWKAMFVEISATLLFTIAAEIHGRSLANFYRQYADRHKFEIHATSQRARADSSTICYRKKQIDFRFIESVLLLTTNCDITLSK